jgi:hypothetical protein
MGKLKLFDYTDEKSKRHFFVQKDDGKIDELPYVKYLSTTGKLVEMPFYQGTLKNLTKDCRTINEPPSTYAEKPLTRYVNSYNECMGISTAPKKKEKSRLVPFVMAGVAIGHGSFHGNETGSFSGTSAGTGKYSSTTGFLAGAGFELASSRASSRFLPGIQVAYQQTGKTTREVSASGGTSSYTMDFTMLPKQTSQASM